MADRIRERAIAWAIAAVDAARIDQINIYHASRLAMLHAVEQLHRAARYLLVDAMKLDCEVPQQAIIHGDALSVSIAAASIIAKVERDRMVAAWDPVYPVYGLASNKGYSTPQTSGGAARAWTFAAAPAVVRAGVECAIAQEVLGFMREDRGNVRRKSKSSWRCSRAKDP